MHIECIRNGTLFRCNCEWKFLLEMRVFSYFWSRHSECTLLSPFSWIFIFISCSFAWPIALFRNLIGVGVMTTFIRCEFILWLVDFTLALDIVLVCVSPEVMFTSFIFQLAGSNEITISRVQSLWQRQQRKMSSIHDEWSY